MTTAKTACILCSRNCGLEVDVVDGHLKKFRGDTAHPSSKGYLCNKAARLDFYQNHADRLTHPLKRTADGSFVRVTWEQALGDIAQRLNTIRDTHGGDAFAFVGGGGQGNHLGGAYGRQMLPAMKSRFVYSSLAQEKTGDFWVNGRMFGAQNCHPMEDVEHADYVIFIGANPYQSHGIVNARDVLKDIKNDPQRTMVVIDPRRTETADQADIHLQLRPGTDAFLLLAMLSIIVRENLHDQAFIDAHCTGFETVKAELLTVPVADYASRSDVPLADVERVARGFSAARRGCVRVDLGTQQTLHTTLNAYLEKLLYLITGNFGKVGSNNLHTAFLPVIGNTDETQVKPGRSLKRTVFHKMMPIAGMYPPNILPDEILKAGEQRIRAVVCESANPLLTFPDSAAQEEAFRALELLVVVDIAMTETARLAHYILPAASQFEKIEATGFTLEFPENYFHLRQPLLPPLGESLPEPEIYTRLLEAMGVLPRKFPLLSAIARIEPATTSHLGYMTALGVTLSRKKHWAPYAASILYRTLGRALPQAAAAPLLPIAMGYAKEHAVAVRRAGHKGSSLTLGASLFRAITGNASGTVTSKHEHSEMWSLLKTPDQRVHLHVAEMLDEIRILENEAPLSTEFPFILMAGERRTYNANQIFRDPAWRKVDQDGALRIHPDDARALFLKNGDIAECRTARGALEVTVEIDDALRRGVVTLPHGYGASFQNSKPKGPPINRLTSIGHCEPFSKTPFHKYVPASISGSKKSTV
jgi:anaerobic selenocysteine-containing dehydrogenase